MTTPNRQQIEAALAQLTPHPLKLWHTNPDGTITAINTIGQKFILRLQPPSPRVEEGRAGMGGADPPPKPPKPKKK